MFVSRLTKEVVEERYLSNNTFTVLSWDIIQTEVRTSSQHPLSILYILSQTI